MEKKFHLVDGEPKPCTASIRDCPVGGEHFATEAEARSNYESSNEQNLIKSLRNTYNGMSSKNRERVRDTIGMGSGVVALGIGGALILTSMASDNNEMKKIADNYAKTPYSVSITAHHRSNEPSYTGTLTDSNLKQTNFDGCVNHNYKITCKTADGKYEVSVSHGGRHDNFENAKISIKDGKTTRTISNNKISLGRSTKYIIPKNIIK